MADRPAPRPLTRAIAWLLLVAGFAAWLASAELFPGNGKLYDAIAAGDAREVRRLLAAGADPNSSASPLTLTRTTTRRYQYAPLIYALRRNQPDAALALVEAGADPNARDLNGASALVLANRARMAEVVNALSVRRAVAK
ncbi:MAG: ankyrin repeat domain-containing protein [Gemmatimonadota bacterium]